MLRHLLFVLFVTAATVSAMAISVWDGQSSRWTKGIGVESDPFVISTAQEFAFLSEGGSYDGKYFVVETDIDLNNHSWSPIGYSETSPFKGKIDFKGHQITGLNVNISGDRYVGLFGYVENASIENLLLYGTVRGKNYVGGIVGLAKNTSLQNLYNYSDVYSYGNYAYVGGVAGIAENSTFVSCSNFGTIKNDDEIKDNGASEPHAKSFIGGIVGSLDSDSYVNRCCNKGVVSGYSVMATALYRVSGISGEGGHISFCYNIGNISCNLRYVRWYNNGTIAYVAGIATDANSISNCYNIGSISGSSYWAGRYAAIATGYYEEIDAGANHNYSTWDIHGCKATSYTAQSEKLNGIRISVDDLKKLYLVNELNDGTTIYKQDVSPYLNNGLPFLDSEPLINVSTEQPIDVGLSKVRLIGRVSFNGYSLSNTWFEVRKKGNLTSTRLDGFETADLLNLIPNTSYSVCYCVETSSGKIYKGNDVEFRTKNFSCEVFTFEPQNIETSKVTLKGSVVANEDDVSLCGFEYKTATSKDWIDVSAEIQNSYYIEYELTDISPNTSYEVRAFAEVEGFRCYGDIIPFSTQNASIHSIMERGWIYEYHGDILSIQNATVPIEIFDIRGNLIFKSSKKEQSDINIRVRPGIYILNGVKIMLR